MNKRMTGATISLVGLFIALYLTLFKVGVIGTLACAVGSCETVQLSRWATFLGLPVAAWGVGYYAAVLGVCIAGVQERRVDSRAVSLWLVLLTSWGLLFSAWLTYIELFVIHAICQWCVASAFFAGALFVVAMLDWREKSSGGHGPSAETSDSSSPR
jgi:uncharacterized membrane protein